MMYIANPYNVFVYLVAIALDVRIKLFAAAGLPLPSYKVSW